MEPIVRLARPVSWNRRNRLMNRQGTVSNRPEPERSNQVPNGTGTGWNQNRTGPTRTVAITNNNKEKLVVNESISKLSVSFIILFFKLIKF